MSDACYFVLPYQDFVTGTDLPARKGSPRLTGVCGSRDVANLLTVVHRADVQACPREIRRPKMPVFTGVQPNANSPSF